MHVLIIAHSYIADNYGSHYCDQVIFILRGSYKMSCGHLCIVCYSYDDEQLCLHPTCHIGDKWLPEGSQYIYCDMKNCFIVLPSYAIIIVSGSVTMVYFLHGFL